MRNDATAAAIMPHEYGSFITLQVKIKSELENCCLPFSKSIIT